jgi:hypothetical protein
MVREFKRKQNPTTKKWEDTTETTDKPEVIHFVDPVTGQTRSEKMTNKEAEVKAQFENRYNSDYILDKTKGKGKTAAPAAATNAEPPANPFNKSEG